MSAVVGSAPVLTSFLVESCSHSFLLQATCILSILLWFQARSFLNSDLWRNRMINRGIFGLDINKTTAETRAKIKAQLNNPPEEQDPNQKGPPNKIDGVEPSLRPFVIPESAGIVGIVYIFHVLVLFVLCPGQLEIAVPVPVTCLVILLALTLGWLDDVLEVRWREKVVYSLLCTIPMLLVYNGSTTIVIPAPFRNLTVGDFQIWGTHLDLGLFYLGYMCLWCVFCTNSINILAGVNGLEVGQSLIIAISVLIHNCIQCYKLQDQPGGAAGQHIVSIIFILPFIAVCIALWQSNKFPAKWFIGDSFCYFAGTVLACSSIVGQFTKTLMLFFIPQLINFVISLPQLAPARAKRFVPFYKPCPRHRLPRWNPKTGKMENSYNYTLLNASIAIFGPQTESQLCNSLLAFQVLCCILAFVVRYYLAGFFYEEIM